METPIAVRYALFVVVSIHEHVAACHATALSFLGIRHSIPSRFCSSPLSPLLIERQINYRLLESEFKQEAAQLATFLQSLGLNPLDNSMDMNTEVGWANVVSKKLVEYFANDGWNSLGDISRNDFFAPFEDPTGYEPQNPAHLSTSKLLKPLRWQPLTQQSDFRGRFATQVHVVPHLGELGKPLVISDRNFRSRKAPPIYATPDRMRTISREDLGSVNKFITDLFSLSRSITEKQLALAYWWENKFLSLGFFIPFYASQLNLSAAATSRLFLGEMIAQHDAVLLAWKEKRRHDNVRPQTMIRRLLKGKTVRAFRGIGKGVSMVSADDWEPVLRTQPHSEYPSGSAAICSASLEHLQIALSSPDINEGGSIPAFELNLPQGVFLTPFTKNVTIRFETLKEAAESCGFSRLTAGVHFGPSVPAGSSLTAGIGEAAFKHVSDLYEGRIPEDCARCIHD
eukprot:TRINITY_DN453_c0_g2_i1.p1 TRINITY_DN453_c0_g2~~TRINITY_DN453_c0_g2_i1.p1  ORF type:complete len:520 (-),score=58.80 TRINITY_DN453_c0_g2_i1:2177-3541(-)